MEKIATMHLVAFKERRKMRDMITTFKPLNLFNNIDIHQFFKI